MSGKITKRRPRGPRRPRTKTIDGVTLHRCHGNNEHYVLRELMSKNKNKIDGLDTICLDCQGVANRANPSREVYRHMCSHSKDKGRAPPEMTMDAFVVRRAAELTYDIGWHMFEMTLEPGHWNTSSPDRYDDDIGYTNTNFRFRPAFLNTPHAFTDDEMRNLPLLAQVAVLDDIEDIIAKAKTRPWIKRPDGTTRQVKGVFASIAGSIQRRTKGHAKDPNRLGDTTPRKSKDIMDGMHVIARRQKYRCHYTGIPLIFATKSGPMKVSLERLNPRYTYGTPGNDVLCCVGLQSGQTGQRNPRMTDGQRQEAVDKARIPEGLFKYN